MSTGPETPSDRAKTGQAETSSERASQRSTAATAEDDVGVVFLNSGEPPTPDREPMLACLADCRRYVPHTERPKGAESGGETAPSSCFFALLRGFSTPAVE